MSIDNGAHVVSLLISRTVLLLVFIEVGCVATFELWFTKTNIILLNVSLLLRSFSEADSFEAMHGHYKWKITEAVVASACINGFFKNTLQSL